MGQAGWESVCIYAKQLMNARTLLSATVDSYRGQEEKLVFRIDFEHTVVPLPRGTCRLA